MFDIDAAVRAMRDADPVPDPESLRRFVADSAVFLDATRERSMEIEKEPEALETQETATPLWHKAMPALVAVAVVILFAAAVVLLTRNSEPDVADTPQGMAELLIAAFNAGDADAMLALLTPDVALSEKYSDPSEFGNADPFDAIDRAFFEQHMAWATAQGATFTTPECVATEQGAAGAATVACEFGWLYAAEKAAGATPVPTRLTMVVTPDGISQLAFEYAPEFGVHAFDEWVLFNHFDNSELVEFREWDSVADAEQSGKLRAQYVAEWVADLEATD